MEDKGYKIWRKDNQGWELAFDTVYPTREKVDERIAELNAAYHEMVQLGELQFYPYREDIRLARDGSIRDVPVTTTAKLSEFTKRNKKPNHRHRRRKPRACNSMVE
jgi:hypothetical protein